MKKTEKKFPKCIALSLVVALLMVTASGIAAASSPTIVDSTPAGESIHEKINISEITGEIAEPPMLTSAASSIAAEKEWYEYVYYSSEPVGYYYLSSATRLAFYDPYDYADALVMEVNDNITDWSSNNTLQVSYTTGNSITETEGKSDETITTTQEAYTDTETTTVGENAVRTTINNRTDSYNTSKTISETDDDTWTVTETIGAETGEDFPLLGTKISASLDISNTNNFGLVTTTTRIEGDTTDERGNVMTGYTKSSDETVVNYGEVTTTITNDIAKRISKATGNSTNSSISLSTNNSTTITKTYDASHFNANGSPLQWKVIQYTVKMPMKYQLQYLIDDEWVFGDYSYCLLTTIQGTTRAWLQNNVAYYEHWGTGEAVTWDDFWSQFFTEESLISAYQNRLYPDN